jgi:NAD(P)-dependent dehydrogenase (short-subunit alcohol dehydrogenase family)
VAADLAREPGAEKTVAEAIKAYGRVDILVNAARVGYSWMEKSPDSMNDIVNTSPEKWREVLAINLDAAFYMCRLAIPQMRKQGGARS